MINKTNANTSYNTYTDYERKQVRAMRKEKSYTARANTIVDDDKRAVATELKNRILHGDYSEEKRWELSTQFRELVAAYGDMFVGIQLPVSMRINVGTEGEPIWAAIRGDNIWIHKGHLDDFLSDEVRPENWVNPWVKLQDANGLDESIISRLLQYQEILRSVNANAGFVGFPTESEPANSTLFNNLREAVNFFNNNSVAENEDGFRSFVTWLFADRASNAQETALANQLSNQFLDVFFAQLRENSNTEQSFLTAWNSIIANASAVCYDNFHAKAAKAIAHTISAATSNSIPPIQRYTQMLTKAMSNGTGNGNPNLIGSPNQVLNAKLFNISVAFGEISNQNGTNSVALQNAFRDLVRTLFDDAAVATHGNTADETELAQMRADARAMGETFLVRFFASKQQATPQVLRDTGMKLTELAFHEAWNLTTFETGTLAIGGTTPPAIPGELVHWDLNGNPREPQCEVEFRRLVMEMLLQMARDNAEVFRQWAEMRAEEAERLRKTLLIAARIAAGDNVPPQDKQFLLSNSPGLYMIAKASQVENDNPYDYDSVLSDDEGESDYSSSSGGDSVSSSGTSSGGGSSISSGSVASSGGASVSSGSATASVVSA